MLTLLRPERSARSSRCLSGEFIHIKENIMKKIKVALTALTFLLFAQLAHADLWISGYSARMTVQEGNGSTYVINVSGSTLQECEAQLIRLRIRLHFSGDKEVGTTRCNPHWSSHFELIEELPPWFFEKVELPRDPCALICTVIGNGDLDVLFGKKAALVQDVLIEHRFDEYLKIRTQFLDQLNKEYGVDEMFNKLPSVQQ